MEHNVSPREVIIEKSFWGMLLQPLALINILENIDSILNQERVIQIQELCGKMS